MSRYARKTPSSQLLDGTVLWRRFWAKVRKTDACWLWTGATSGWSGVSRAFYPRPVPA